MGVWQTQPDRKALVSHIQVTMCGRLLCGTVLRAFDSRGKEVVTRNVGKKLFWDLEPLGGGDYGHGTVYVPFLNVTAKASMVLRGDHLSVKGCMGKICDGQVWTRVR